MEKRTRRLLYYSLLAIFTVLTPILLLHAIGYRVDFGGRELTETGGVFIKSSLSRLSVSLDSRTIKETGFLTGSVLLTDIPIGSHVLEITREGYQPWHKSLDIEAFAVVELRNIVFVPRDIALATTTTSALPATSTQPDQTFVVTLDTDDVLSVQENGTTTLKAENIHSFGLIGQTVYFVNNHGFLGRLNLSSKNVETIERPGFFLSEVPVLFRESANGTLAVIDSSGGLFLTDPSTPLMPVESVVRNAAFDGRAEKLLIEKEYALSIMWLADNPVQPFQKRFTKEDIIRTPSPILRSAWYYRDNAHVVFQTKEGIFLTEVDGRGGRNTYELLSGPAEEFFTSPEEPTRVFARRGSTWYSIEL